MLKLIDNQQFNNYQEDPIVELTTDNGSSSDNYSITCFNMSATTPVTSGSGPFNGNYRPEGNLADFNNGQNADGNWQLCVADDGSGDVGTLNSWSIEFGNDPAQSPPPLTNDDTCDAILLDIQSISMNFNQFLSS